MEVDMKMFCRLCAKEDSFCIDVFGEDGSKNNISKKIRLCLPIIIKEDDNYPKQICLTCLNKLDTSYELYSGCMSAQTTLKKLLRMIESNSSPSRDILQNETEQTSTREIEITISRDKPVVRVGKTVLKLQDNEKNRNASLEPRSKVRKLQSDDESDNDSNNVASPVNNDPSEESAVDAQTQTPTSVVSVTTSNQIPATAVSTDSSRQQYGMSNTQTVASSTVSHQQYGMSNTQSTLPHQQYGMSNTQTVASSNGHSSEKSSQAIPQTSYFNNVNAQPNRYPTSNQVPVTSVNTAMSYQQSGTHNTNTVASSNNQITGLPERLSQVTSQTSSFANTNTTQSKRYLLPNSASNRLPVTAVNTVLTRQQSGRPNTMTVPSTSNQIIGNNSFTDLNTIQPNGYLVSSEPLIPVVVQPFAAENRIQPLQIYSQTPVYNTPQVIQAVTGVSSLTTGTENPVQQVQVLPQNQVYIPSLPQQVSSAGTITSNTSVQNYVQSAPQSSQSQTKQAVSAAAVSGTPTTDVSGTDRTPQIPEKTSLSQTTVAPIPLKAELGCFTPAPDESAQPLDVGSQNLSLSVPQSTIATGFSTTDSTDSTASTSAMKTVNSGATSNMKWYYW